jgi:hypothetical protein
MMKKVIRLIPILLLINLTLAPTLPVNASSIWYVAHDGSGEDCTQAAPCQLDYAVQSKSQGGDTILAKSGIYRDGGDDHPYITYIYKSLTLIGSCSFEASGPVVCNTSQRDSYLDGELQRRVIIIQGIPGDGMHVSISGFTIMRGNGGGNPVGSCESAWGSTMLGCGGGVFAEGVDYLELNDNEIWANRGSNSSPVTTDVSLGGGVYAEDVGQLVLTNNLLRFNQAGSEGQGFGGGIYLTDSGNIAGVLIENNIFDNNELTSNQPGNGAGICAIYSEGIQVNQNLFEYQNYLARVSVDGSAIYMLDLRNSYIYNNRFQQNFGRSSIFVVGLPGELTDVVINRNKITNEETADNIAVIGNTDLLIMNNFIGNNNPLTNSNGIYTQGSIAYGNPNAFIAYNTFALVEYGLYIDENSDITVENNIFTQINSTAVYDNDQATNTLDVDSNLFHDNGNDGERGTIYFSGDPLLVDAPNGDFHIQAGSAAIDKVYSWQGGIDIDGQMRGIGTPPNNFDVGADEYMLVNYLPLILK